MEEISLRDIINYFISKIKLIIIVVLCVFVCGLVLNGIIKTSEHTNYATVMITQTDEDKFISVDSDNNAIYSKNNNNDLIPTYIETIKSRSLMKKVIETLNLTYTQEELIKMIKLETIPSTNLVRVHITTTKSAEEAAAIANNVVQIFKTEVNGEKNDVTVTIIDEAEPLIEEGQNNVIKASLISIILGVFISIGLVLVIYCFDNTIKSEKEIEILAKLNILGTLPYIKKFNQIAINKNKNSFVSDGFKLIKTNLSFKKSPGELKSLLVTSPSVNEGKKFIACNLAIVYAQENKKVLLVDANLREGKLHEVFGLKNDNGLSEILANKKMDLKNKINNTEINNLDIITCGNHVINSNELLTLNFEEFIKVVEKIYDLVIIVSSPVEIISDGLVISKYVDGTLLVVSYRTTDLNKLIEAKNIINNVGNNIAGVVFNKNYLLKEKKYKDYYIE